MRQAADHVKIKKVRIGYLCLYFLLPAGGALLLSTAVVLLAENGTVASLLITTIALLTILGWRFFGDTCYARRKKRMLQELAGRGFHCSHLFEGSSVTVLLDQVHGKLGLLFRWNPHQYYLLPSTQISKVWVDDGCGGIGPLRGTCRVRVLFTVKEVTVRMSTFVSNRPWRPDSDNVLVGISEAELMAELLNAAREVS